MLAYIARRLVALIAVLFGVSLIIFAILKFVPGDPARLVAGMDASEADVQNIRHQLGLDRPVYVQYVTFVGNALHGNFGRSTRSLQPVSAELKLRLPATIELAVAAMLLATVFGVVLGVIAAVRPYSIWDNLSSFLAISGVSMPTFWLGLMLILIFSVTLRWFPVSGRGGLRHLVLPALTLAATSSAIIARQTRSDMLEVLHQDYVRTARAKGLTEQGVVFRHALRNALIPTTTVVGLQFGYLLGGAVITETVFAWPGVGRLLVDGIKFRDFPVVQATVLVLATIFVFVNLGVDLLYMALDPRIKGQ